MGSRSTDDNGKADAVADKEVEVVVETLPFLVTFDDADDGGQKGIFRRDHETALRQVPVDVLKSNLRSTVGGLRKLFDDIANEDGVLPLREAQVSFEIAASGAVAVLGTSAGVAATGAITLTFGR